MTGYDGNGVGPSFASTTAGTVSASAVGRPVDIHAYADRIVIHPDGRIMAEYRRSFGHGETVYGNVCRYRRVCCRRRWTARGAVSDRRMAHRSFSGVAMVALGPGSW
jgi:hypothetical protein